MRNRRKDWKRRLLGLSDDRGAIAVEFALLTPILLLFAVGVADFGLIMNERMTLSNAARAGAQYAMAGDVTETEVATVVTESGNFSASDLTVDVVYWCECPDQTAIACTDATCGEEHDDDEGDTARRQYVTVTVTETYDTIFKYPWLETPFTLSGAAEMRVF